MIIAYTSNLGSSIKARSQKEVCDYREKIVQIKPAFGPISLNRDFADFASDLCRLPKCLNHFSFSF